MDISIKGLPDKVGEKLTEIAEKRGIKRHRLIQKILIDYVREKSSTVVIGWVKVELMSKGAYCKSCRATKGVYGGVNGEGQISTYICLDCLRNGNK